MIKIKYYPIRFDQSGKVEKAFEFSRNFQLRDYLDSFKEIPQINFTEFDIIVSGKVVKDFNEFVNDGDEIIVTPKIGDPGTIFGVIATVATALGASATTAATIAAIGTVLAVGATLAAIGYSIYSAFQRPSLPGFGGISGGGGLDEGSPTYGWEGGRTLSDVNVPVPIIYGRHKVYGNVINEYIHSDGDKHFLNMLVALGEGEINSISDLKLNDNPIANFQGVSFVSRMGTNNQTIIPNFEDLHNLIDVNVQLLKNNAYVYTTIDNDVEAFEIRFVLPSGLFQQNADNGEIVSWSVTYRVEYKLTTSGTWIDLGLMSITDKRRASFFRVFRKDGLTAGKYDIRVTKTSDDSTLSPARTGDFYLSQIDEIKTDDLIYPNTALVAIEALAYEQLNGRRPKFSCIVEGKKISIPKVMNGGNEVDWEDYYWDQASGQYKLFSGGTVLSWDGSTYVDKFSANPVWCFKNLITKTRYGLGEFISSSLLDNTLMLELSRYCEEKVPDGNGGFEKRFRLDVVIDSFTKSLDLIQQLAATFNAFQYYSAGTVKLGIDKEETPVQIFGMGNIIENSFRQIWKSVKDIPNEVEVQFLDHDKDYEQETISLRDETALNSGDPVRTHRIRLYCTGVAQVLRVARYALNVAKNVTRSCFFRAGIDAIACQVGDLIGVSHDVPQWGFSGRVKANSTTTLVKLDREVIIENGKTYKIQIRFADDTVEERTVSSAPGTYTQVQVSSAFSQVPADYDVYSFGETNIVTKPFRIYAMRRTEHDEVEIECVEYIEAVYDDSAVTIPQTNYSALSREIPDVSNLTAVEKNVRLKDGTIGSIIEVYFSRPDRTTYAINQFSYAKIYFSDNFGASWIFAGSTFSDSFAITEGIQAGKTYKVAVASTSADGAENAIADSPQVSITALGKLAPPSNVTGFDVQQRGDRLRFSWNPITDGDLARYIIKKGGDWPTGQTIAEKVDVTEFEYPIGTIGEQTYMIKAIDTSGNESVSSATDTLTVIPPPEGNFVVQLDPWAQNREYKLTNIDRIQLNLFDPAYARDVFVLKTQDTWADVDGQDWEGLNLGNKLVEASGEIEQIEPIDLGVIFEFNLLLDILFNNVAGGSITVQVSTSENGTTFTAFADINPEENYRARYVKFKIIIETSNTDNQVFFYAATIFIDSPTAKQFPFRDVAIAIGGSTIVFRDDFTQIPRVRGLVVTNGILGIPQITALSITSMTVKVWDPITAAYIGTAEVSGEVVGA